MKDTQFKLLPFFPIVSQSSLSCSVLLLISPRPAARINMHTLPGGLIAPRESAARVQQHRGTAGGSARRVSSWHSTSYSGHLKNFWLLLLSGDFFFLIALMHVCLFFFPGKQDYKKTKSALRATRLKAEAKKNSSGFRVNLLSTMSTRYCSLYLCIFLFFLPRKFRLSRA